MTFRIPALRALQRSPCRIKRTLRTNARPARPALSFCHGTQTILCSLRDLSSSSRRRESRHGPHPQLTEIVKKVAKSDRLSLESYRRDSEDLEQRMATATSKLTSAKTRGDTRAIVRHEHRIQYCWLELRGTALEYRIKAELGRLYLLWWAPEDKIKDEDVERAARVQRDILEHWMCGFELIWHRAFAGWGQVKMQDGVVEVVRLALLVFKDIPLGAVLSLYGMAIEQYLQERLSTRRRM